MGVFQPGETFAPEINLPVTLHVFEIYYTPTKAELARLRNEPPCYISNTARSKLFRKDKAIDAKPIDTVAARVSVKTGNS